MDLSSHGLELWGALTAITTAVVSVLVGFLVLVQLKDRSSRRYDLELHMARLSMAREEFETKITQLNRELVATEQRWRDANHLLLDAQNAQHGPAVLSPPRLSRFLSSMGLTEEDLHVDPKLVFMLTPFSKEEMETFDTVKRVCAGSGLTCVRGDEAYVPSNILSHIVKQIVRARIVVAAISSRNANVFFELGIAQALDKTVILISKTLDEVPFDLQSQRIITYSTTRRLESQLQAALLSTYADTPGPGPQARYLSESSP